MGGAMKARELVGEYVKLVAPDIERDAPLAVKWLNSKKGVQTLISMGNVPASIKKTNLETEQKRIVDFIESSDQLNWMIEFEDQIVGSIWVNLKETKYVKAPSVHIMIGDSSFRKRGIGYEALELVIQQMARLGRKQLFSRHLVSNKHAAKALEKLWFDIDGPEYTDKDGLVWQNVILELE